VLVLGCGLGGVVAAKETRRLLGNRARVVVIDRDPIATYPPSYLWVVNGERRLDAIRRRRERLARHGIEFVIAEVRQVDIASRYVRADSREFTYDYLVIALGAETTFEGTPGFAEAAQSLYTAEGAERLAAALRYFAGGRVVIAATSETYKGPGAPYELAMVLEQSFHSRRMRQKVELDVFTPEPQPLAFAGAEAAETVRGLLAHKGIGLHTGRLAVSADPQRRELKFADEGVESFQLLIGVPEHRAPAVLREAGLVDESGWVSVNRDTLRTSHERVYAIGDVVHLATAGGTLLPKIASLAASEARTVARQIAWRLRGGRSPRPFDARAALTLEVGAGAALEITGDFLSARRPPVVKQPSIAWRLTKAAAERMWLLRTY
jgi:sulfide:quinone oxidoreductase